MFRPMFSVKLVKNIIRPSMSRGQTREKRFFVFWAGLNVRTDFMAGRYAGHMPTGSTRGDSGSGHPQRTGGCGCRCGADERPARVRRGFYGSRRLWGHAAVRPELRSIQQSRAGTYPGGSASVIRPESADSGPMSKRPDLPNLSAVSSR